MRIKKNEENLLEVNDIVQRVCKVFRGLSAAFETVPYVRLFYRCLEMDKIKPLKFSSGNFDAMCTISQEGAKEITCWRDNIKTQKSF